MLHWFEEAGFGQGLAAFPSVAVQMVIQEFHDEGKISQRLSSFWSRCYAAPVTILCVNLIKILDKQSKIGLFQSKLFHENLIFEQYHKPRFAYPCSFQLGFEGFSNMLDFACLSLLNLEGWSLN